MLASLIEHMFAANPPAELLWNDPLYRTTLHHATRSLLSPCRPRFEVSDREKELPYFLVPLYLGYACNNQGWCGEVQNATIEDMRAWGEYVGDRYGKNDDIVWVIGGDMDPTPVKSKVHAMVDGILSRDTRHPFTVQGGRGIRGCDTMV